MQVSILMPAFNAERYISETIESVLSQTYKDFEFLIIDDGSTDRTLSIAKSYAQRDKRVKAISQPNVGMGTSLNQALDLVDNEWIVRMDADDVMLPNRIERQMDFVRNDMDIAVTSSYVLYTNEHGEVIGKSPRSLLTSRVCMEEFVQRNKSESKNDLQALPTVGFPHFMIYHPAVLMRRSVVKAVGGYRPEFWPVEDFDLWNRVIERGYMVLIQPEYLLKYRRHESSGSIQRARQTSLKIGWVENCAARRRSGQPELSWEEFLEIRQQGPWWHRLNQERMDLARVLYSAARSNFFRRRYHLFAPTILGAALLQPTYVLPRVLSFRYFGGRSGFSR